MIAATNRDLRAEVLAGRFREDLFYRLSSIEIHVPGLSERPEDIPVLVQHFLKKYGQTYGKSFQGLSRRAQIVLLQHDWPGNVRELENVISSAAITANADFIDVSDLPTHLQKPHRRASPTSRKTGARCHSTRFAASTFSAVLEMCNGNRVRAAQVLGIGRTSLYRFLKRTNKPAAAAAKGAGLAHAFAIVSLAHTVSLRCNSPIPPSPASLLFRARARTHQLALRMLLPPDVGHRLRNDKHHRLSLRPATTVVASLVIPIEFSMEVSGFDHAGRFFTERTSTVDASFCGCKFHLRTPVEKGTVVAIRLLNARRQIRDGACHPPFSGRACGAGKARLDHRRLEDPIRQSLDCGVRRRYEVNKRGVMIFPA